jgi:hypothetical protein
MCFLPPNTFVSFLATVRRMKKLMHRVTFPWELKMVNTTGDCPDAGAVSRRMEMRGCASLTERK